MALSETVGSYSEFNYTGSMQQVTIPADGIYKLEVYGAQGGNATSYDGITKAGGKGGYSVGYIKLTKEQTIYICVGGAGGDAKFLRNLSYSSVAGGYNGGGTGKATGNTYDIAAAGGGATHIAIASGTIASLGTSNKSKILIIAGGGGGAFSRGDLYGPGGAGGGSNGSNGVTERNNSEYDAYSGTGGSQTSAGKNNNSKCPYPGGYGHGGNANGSVWGAGGGGGLYGGGGGRAGAGGGGSGYISGVPSFSYNGTTYAPSTSNGKRSGNGYAKITLVDLILTKIYNLNVDGSTVQTVYLDGVALEQIKVDGVSVFGNP